MSLKGADAHKRRLKKLSSGATIRLLGAALYKGADTIRAEAHRGISAGSVSGKNHVPSSPGEYPNRDTGVLQAHLKATQPAPLTAEVRSEAPYAAALEFGTSKMAARPHLRTARDAKLREVEQEFAKDFDKIIARSGD